MSDILDKKILYDIYELVLIHWRVVEKEKEDSEVFKYDVEFLIPHIKKVIKGRKVTPEEFKFELEEEILTNA